MVDKAYSDLEKALSRLQDQCRKQQECIDALMKDQGIEGAIKDLSGKVVEALQMNSLRALPSYDKGVGETIDELRGSLARPSFDALEANFARAAFPQTQQEAGA